MQEIFHKHHVAWFVYRGHCHAETDFQCTEHSFFALKKLLSSVDSGCLKGRGEKYEGNPIGHFLSFLLF